MNPRDVIAKVINEKAPAQEYNSAQEALAAGIPADRLVEIVRIGTGPFKGRIYERRPGNAQLVRRRDLELRR